MLKFRTDDRRHPPLKNHSPRWNYLIPSWTKRINLSFQSSLYSSFHLFHRWQSSSRKCSHFFVFIILILINIIIFIVVVVVVLTVVEAGGAKVAPREKDFILISPSLTVSRRDLFRIKETSSRTIPLFYF